MKRMLWGRQGSRLSPVEHKGSSSESRKNQHPSDHILIGQPLTHAKAYRDQLLKDRSSNRAGKRMSAVGPEQAIT